METALISRLSLVATIIESGYLLLIYEEDLAKFAEPEKTYLNKKICVTGKLVLYNEKPQIVLTEAKQLTLGN